LSTPTPQKEIFVPKEELILFILSHFEEISVSSTHDEYKNRNYASQKFKKLNRIKDYQFKSIIFLKESFLVVGSNGCGEAI